MTDALDELAKAAQSRPIPQRQVEVPEYPGIVRGARLIRLWAMVHTLLGIAVFLVGTALACWVMYHRTADERPGFIAQILGSWFLCLVGAILLFVWGTMIRLYAELCEAQRDIAVNTFLMRFRR